VSTGLTPIEPLEAGRPLIRVVAHLVRKLQRPGSVYFLVFRPSVWLVTACLAVPGWLVPVQAEPVPADQAADLQSELPEVTPGAPVDIEQWMRIETTRVLSTPEIDEDRRSVLAHGWQPRPPTWIQGSTLVNLGDYPTLDDSAERAERDLQTLTWVIEEQRRQAAGQTQRHGDEAGVSHGDDPWFRRLLPRAWIGVLKENREWVAAGGTALLVIVWGASIFARRPGRPALPIDAPAPKSARRHRRRRHRGLQLP
jgi:hypothetical protein